MAFQHIKIRCCRASQRFNSLSIDVNVKNRWSQSRNTKDFEDFFQRPVCGAEMGFVWVVMSLPTSHQSKSIAWRTTQIATR
jgi:hypothetical protein